MMRVSTPERISPRSWAVVASVLVLAVAGACAPSTRSRRVGPQADLLVRGATVIDGTGAEPRLATIVIRDSVIVDVVDGDRPRPADEVIDARGTWVVPGLWDAHVHFGTGGRVPVDEREKARLRRQLLWYGVTSVLSVGGTGGSAAEITALRARPAGATEGVETHIYATGSAITIPGSHPVGTVKQLPEGADPATYDWERQGVAVVRSVAEAREVVRRHAAAGMDGIKIIVESGPSIFGDDHPQMPPEMVAAVVEEAAAHGLPVLAHVSSLDELEEVVAAGARASAHAVVEPPFPGRDLYRRMAAEDVFYVPTLSLVAPALTERFETLDDPFLTAGVEAEVLQSLSGGNGPMAPTGMTGEQKRAYMRSLLDSIGRAHDEGVKIALGTDTNMPFVFPGYSVHVEMELLAEAGLEPMDVLLAATRRPAELLGVGDEVGTVEPGRRADLLVLDRDPLEDIRNTRSIRQVISDGRVVDRAALL